MKKKISIIAIVLAAIGALLAVRHIGAARELGRLTAAVAEADEIEVSVGDYTTGRGARVTDAEEVKAIREEVSHLRYGGRFWGETEPVTPADGAYSLILSTKDVEIFLILYPSGEKSHMVGLPFHIAIKNAEGLYQAAQRAFA